MRSALPQHGRWIHGEHAITIGIRVGWFVFEGFGFPYEGWIYDPATGKSQVIGRALTRERAHRLAERHYRAKRAS